MKEGPSRRERRIKRIRRITSGYLRVLARFKLRRCYGQIIGITGSLGKSSTKEAIVKVLESEYSVDRSDADYNTELGLLVSLFRQRSGETSRKRWLKAIVGATGNFLTDNTQYDKLVLEMGAAWPGGMTEILRVFRPEIAVFTGVSRTHLAEGGHVDEPAIFEEKAKLIRTLERGTAILNRDNPYCRRFDNEDSDADLLWYGRLAENQPVASLPAGLYFDQLSSSIDGISADVHLSRPGANEPQESHRLSSPILGEHHIYILLPAILTGLVAGLDLEQSCEALSTFSLPAGRMTPIPGIRSCTIIDSSRNAAPDSVKAALETLGDYPAQRRLALLGSIHELGDKNESLHRAIGEVAHRHAQMLITVGPEARLIADGARTHGMPEHLIQSFDTPEDAGFYLREIVRHGDVLLAKGSRTIYLERAIKLLMRDPDQADQLLWKL